MAEWLDGKACGRGLMGAREQGSEQMGEQACLTTEEKVWALLEWWTLEMKGSSQPSVETCFGACQWLMSNACLCSVQEQARTRQGCPVHDRPCPSKHILQTTPECAYSSCLSPRLPPSTPNLLTFASTYLGSTYAVARLMPLVFHPTAMLKRNSLIAPKLICFRCS